MFRSAIVEEINNRVCQECGLTTDNIRDHEFSCQGLTNHIVYRAMVVGTNARSAEDLVSLIQSWVASGRASITALSIRLHMDKRCSTVLDNLDEPVCPLKVESTTQPIISKATTPKPTDKGPSSKPNVAEEVRTGEIVGFLFGAIIILLLAVLIVVIIIVAFKRFRYTPTKRYKTHTLEI